MFGSSKTVLKRVWSFGFVIVFSSLTFLSVIGVSYAEHAWNGFHWRSDNLAPTIQDKTSSTLYNVSAAVSEWRNLGTPVQPTLSTKKRGNIKVTEAFSPLWLGLARIFVKNGHITKAEVKLNTTLLEGLGQAAADHVLCQELGHVLGLDHNRADSDTCMNDQPPQGLGSATSPNGHDREQLSLIYDHVDAPGGKGGKRRGKPSGRWITIHTFWLRYY